MESLKQVLKARRDSERKMSNEVGKKKQPETDRVYKELMKGNKKRDNGFYGHTKCQTLF